MQRTGASVEQAVAQLCYKESERSCRPRARLEEVCHSSHQQAGLVARQLLRGRHRFEAYHRCAESRRLREALARAAVSEKNNGKP
jgi:hypothetical protein